LKFKVIYHFQINGQADGQCTKSQLFNEKNVVYNERWFNNTLSTCLAQHCKHLPSFQPVVSRPNGSPPVATHH